VSAEARERVADFERASRDGCLVSHLASEVLLLRALRYGLRLRLFGYSDDHSGHRLDPNQIVFDSLHPGMFSATTWIACRWRSLMGYIFPVAGMQGYLNLKGYGEFDHDNRPDGWNVWLTFVLSPAPATAEASPSPMLTEAAPHVCNSIKLSEVHTSHSSALRKTRRTTSSGSTSTARSGRLSTSPLIRASNFTPPRLCQP